MLSTLPKSTLGQAVTYLKNQEACLRAYLDDGEINISNCWVENLIRPLALGRKNWLFVGNEACGQKAALLYSLVQTCKLHDINPYPYFSYVLTQVDALRREDIEARTLLPQFIDRTLLG